VAIIARSYDTLVSPRCPPGVKPPSEMDMSDGCGLINLQALYHLHQRLNLWHEVPTAIQCRLAGAKVFFFT
jgi:RNA-dependent RNA polymerase